MTHQTHGSQQAKELFLRLSETAYPTGSFSTRGENLRVLTRDESTYIPPLCPAQIRTAYCPIVVPTQRNIIRNRKKIEQIMQLAHQTDTNLLLFICSNDANKEDVATVAARYPGLRWAAIDGPFSYEHMPHRFRTTYSALSYGGQKDISQKRNLALQLARLLGWKMMLFLDDDVAIERDQLYKAIDLLQNGNTSMVGFSARSFPDRSVAMHAHSWADGPSDSFLGSGALAIRTDTEVMSFFPHIYNEDWLFLVTHYLFGEGNLVWAGTIRQQAYKPFRNLHRAEVEEPGDLLAESLMRLVMSIIPTPPAKRTFAASAKLIGELADEQFWEREIDNRITFIRNTQAIIQSKKLHPYKKHQALKALDRSLERLLGAYHIHAQELTEWVQSWLHDLELWNTELPAAASCQNLAQALRVLKLDNQLLDNSAAATPNQHESASPAITTPSLAPFSDLPQKPRSPQRIQGLEGTQLIESYLATRHLNINHIPASTRALRLDRPLTETLNDAQELTVSMFIAAHEPLEHIAKSVRQIVKWNQSNAPIQLIVWVQGQPDDAAASLERYRNMLTVRLIHEVVGTNIRLRSSITAADKTDIDSTIDESLAKLASAYWQHGVRLNHEILVCNSSNELIRQGTFWQFMRQQHTIPRQPLRSYLEALPATQPLHTISTQDDAKALIQSRAWLAAATARRRIRLPRSNATAHLSTAMRHAELSWLQQDDLAQDIRLPDPKDKEAFLTAKTVVCIPIAYTKSLPSDLYGTVRKIIAVLNSRARSQQKTGCMIVVYGTQHDSWQQIEQYRTQLMKLLDDASALTNAVCISLIYQISEGEHPGLLKKRAIATARYNHWLYNDELHPKITWCTVRTKG